MVRGKSLTYRMHLFLFLRGAKPAGQGINKLGRYVGDLPRTISSRSISAVIWVEVSDTTGSVSLAVSSGFSAINRLGSGRAKLTNPLAIGFE